MTSSEYITTKEAQILTKMSESTIRRYIKDNKDNPDVIQMHKKGKSCVYLINKEPLISRFQPEKTLNSSEKSETKSKIPNEVNLDQAEAYTLLVDHLKEEITFLREEVKAMREREIARDNRTDFLISQIASLPEPHLDSSTLTNVKSPKTKVKPKAKPTEEKESPKSEGDKDKNKGWFDWLFE